jgi:hypothetical protein
LDNEGHGAFYGKFSMYLFCFVYMGLFMENLAGIYFVLCTWMEYSSNSFLNKRDKDDIMPPL